MVPNGADVEMACKVTGNPLDSDDVSWINTKITDWDRRTAVTFHNNVSILKVKRVTTRDMGFFYCIANNGIGSEKNASIRLIVERKLMEFVASSLLDI